MSHIVKRACFDIGSGTCKLAIISINL